MWNNIRTVRMGRFLLSSLLAILLFLAGETVPTQPLLASSLLFEDDFEDGIVAPWIVVVGGRGAS